MNLNADFVGFDTETGGLDSAECALLSIAAVPSWEAPAFSRFILPVGRIDARAVQVNGYTPEEWERRGAITPKQALWEFQRWLFEVGAHRRFEMAAHNAGFDLLFIEAAQGRTGIDLALPKIWHCTKIQMQEAHEAKLFEMAEHKSYASKRRYRLDDLGNASGFWDLEPRAKEHDALQDARCCRHGLLWLRDLKNGKKEGA